MPESEQKTFQKRQVAYKVRISDILNSNFMKDELSAGFIKINDIVVSRVNLIATVVYKTEEEQNPNNVMIDDGTGKIILKTFEAFLPFSKIDVGDMVLVIGKIREFKNEKYIIPEILKKLHNSLWNNVRQFELKDLALVEQKEEKLEEVVENILPTSSENIYLLIKEIDAGDGVDIDDIIKKSGLDDAESVINRLLENGDIFEIKPGRVKVLE